MYYRARCLCTTAERYEQEKNRVGSIAWLIPPSIDNCLVDELTEQLAELALPRPGLRLGQENGEAQTDVLNEHQRRHGRERLRHRVEPEDRVLGHWGTSLG